jgi:transketolase
VAEPPPGTKAEDARRGGYVLLRETSGTPDVVFLATGSEVGIAVEAARELQKGGTQVRVVSLPCLEVFKAQDRTWRESVLPSVGLRVSVEAGRSDPWHEWVGPEGLSIGIDDFGHSAPYQEIAEHLGFTGPKIAARVRERLARR